VEQRFKETDKLFENVLEEEKEKFKDIKVITEEQARRIVELN
jgi:hypothetical protein